jgi:hypothetical protein
MIVLMVVVLVVVILLVVVAAAMKYRVVESYATAHHAACEGRPPRTPAEEDLRQQTLNVLRKIFGHLRTNHATDARAQRALGVWNESGVFFTDDSNIDVSFSQRTRCLVINPATPEVASFPRFVPLVLHHLAHSTCCLHDDRWLDAYLFLLRVATEELGLPAAITCAECTKYGVCSKAVCPKCTWATGSCPPPHRIHKLCKSGCDKI